MRKIYKHLKANNRPTTTQMKLLHWLTQLELSEGSPGDSADILWLQLSGTQ